MELHRRSSTSDDMEYLHDERASSCKQVTNPAQLILNQFCVDATPVAELRLLPKKFSPQVPGVGLTRSNKR